MTCYRISRLLLLWLFKILFRLEVKGRKNLPSAGGFIIASNHRSYLDPIVVGVACPRTLNFMARHDLFNLPILGSWLRGVGVIPLRRNFADITSIKEALRCLRQTRGIALFPEGSRSQEDGFMQDARPGLGLIATRSQVPVVPAFIDGSQKALGRHARFIRPAKIRIFFGRPIYPKHAYRKDNYAYFVGRIMQEINRLSQGGGS